MDNDLGLFDDETDGEEFPNLPPDISNICLKGGITPFTI